MRLLSINSTMLRLTSRDLEALFCSATQMQKQNPYSNSPRNSATFEHKVDLLLNSRSAPPLDNDSQCCVVSYPYSQYSVDLHAKKT